MAYDHIISKYSEPKYHGKFLNARFSYSPPKCLIKDLFGQASKFVLMDHIEDLVSLIHGIPLHSPETSIQGEIIHPVNYVKVNKGKILHDAIKRVANAVCDSGTSSMGSAQSGNNVSGFEQPNQNSYQCDIYNNLEQPPGHLTDISPLEVVNFRPDLPPESYLPYMPHQFVAPEMLTEDDSDSSENDPNKLH